jgi:hypothetical protein
LILADLALWLTTTALAVNTVRRLRKPIDAGLLVALSWLILIPLPTIFEGGGLGFRGTPRDNFYFATALANLTLVGLQFFLDSRPFARLSGRVVTGFQPKASADPNRMAKFWVLGLAAVAIGLAVYHLSLMPKVPLFEMVRGMDDPHKLALDRENSAKLLKAPAMLKYVFTWDSRLLFPLVFTAAILLRWWRVAIPVGILGFLYIVAPLEKFPSMLYLLGPFVAVAIRAGKRVYSPMVILGAAVSLLGPWFVLQSPSLSNAIHHLVQPTSAVATPAPSGASPAATPAGPSAAIMQYSIPRALYGLDDLVFRRIGTIPASVTYEWFAYFPDAHHGFLNGSGWEPWKVLSPNRQSPANMVGRWAYYGKPHYDISSIAAYGSFIADGWAEFGYFGVLAGCVALFVVAVVLELIRGFVKDPFCLACYVPALLSLTASLPSGGLPAIIFSTGLALSPVLCLGYLVSRRLLEGGRGVPVSAGARLKGERIGSVG